VFELEADFCHKNIKYACVNFVIHFTYDAFITAKYFRVSVSRLDLLLISGHS